MSKFTTEIRFLCESESGLEESKGFNNIETILNQSVANIFNFDFPIFDEQYRIPLEKKILRHYYTREIGEETVGLWKLRLCTRLNEIMPYYNQLYISTLYEFNPLYDVDLTTNHQRVDNGTESLTNQHTDSRTLDRATSNTTNFDKDTTARNTTDKDTTNSTTIDKDTTDNKEIERNTTDNGTINEQFSENDTKSVQTSLVNTHHDEENKMHFDVYSDTPQGALTNVVNDTYLTNARKISEANSQDGNYSNNGSEETVEAKNGNSTSTENVVGTDNTTEQTTGTENIEEQTTGTEDVIQNHTGNETSVENSSGSEDISESNTGSYSNSGTSHNVEDYLQHVVGKTAGKSYSAMLKEFRETFLNIDMMVIKELNDLFMGLWE